MDSQTQISVAPKGPRPSLNSNCSITVPSQTTG